MTEDVAVDGTVVVGLGGIGSAAVAALAERGETVLGLDPRPASPTTTVPSTATSSVIASLPAAPTLRRAPARGGPSRNAAS